MSRRADLFRQAALRQSESDFKRHTLWSVDRSTAEFTPGSSETIRLVARCVDSRAFSLQPWRGQARRCYRHYSVGPSLRCNEKWPASR